MVLNGLYFLLRDLAEVLTDEHYAFWPCILENGVGFVFYKIKRLH